LKKDERICIYINYAVVGGLIVCVCFYSRKKFVMQTTGLIKKVWKHEYSSSHNI
jgi:hypothetical protein